MYNLILAFIAMFMFSACGSGSDTGSSGTGAISFDVNWDQQSAESVKSAIRASSDVCSDYGIATINANVLNSSSSSVASASWSCSAHGGTISSVPVGSGYTVRLEGLDSSGTVTWRGETTGVSVSSGSTSSAGTITMSYVGSDATAPTVSSVSPSANATNVSVTTAVTATFSENMASSTINTTNFSLTDGTSIILISGTVSYDSSTKTETFTPSSNLSYSTTYTAIIGTGVKDLAGNAMASSYSWSFTTGSAGGSAPAAPTGVAAMPQDGFVNLSWNAVAGATSYNIYWSTTSGVTKTTGIKISNVTSPYTHTGLTNGTTYYYVVTAVNGYGESGASSQVSGTPQATGTAPSAPTGVSATAGDGQATISWTGSTGATSYNIYWSNTSGVTKTTGTKISNVTSPYTHTGLTNGTTYYYVVTAVNVYGESGESSVVSATPQATGTAPSAPTGVSATAGDSQVQISWTGSTDATSYNIYWSNTSGVTKTTGTKISSVTSPYTHTGLTNGTTYYYVVTAVNSYGESGESSQVSAKPVVWTKQLGTTANDYAFDTVADANGNVYVTGTTFGGFDGNTNVGGADLFIIKYDSAGVKQWTSQLGTINDDYANGVAVDSSGNVYATGYTWGDLDGNTNAGGSDLILVKYDSLGIKQWTRQLGTTGNEDARGVAVDSIGNIYVTGYTQGSLDGNTWGGNADIFLVKYDPSGVKQWSRQLGVVGNDIGNNVVVDSGGNIYVAGETEGGLDGNTNAGYVDLFVVKYDSTGVKQWTKQLGSTNYDYAYGIASDSTGNVYVTGYTKGDLDGNINAGSADVFMVKYDSSGTKQWTKQFGTTNAESASVATDSSGNVYLTGWTKGNLDGNINADSSGLTADTFLVKYDSTGNKQWTRQYGTASDENASGVVVSIDGNIYISGYTTGALDGNTNAGGYDIFLLKYDSAGVKQ